MASLKIVEKNQAGELALGGEKALSLVTFFVPAKKVTRRKAEALIRKVTSNEPDPFFAPQSVMRPR